MLADKLQRLREEIGGYGSCLVAYSGGVDSVLLAHVAHEVLGNKTLAVLADSPSLPRRELKEALTVAAQFQIPVRVIKTAEFENPDYVSNPANRCYFCKNELFTELAAIACQENFVVIAYGENATDVGDFRPGAQAAQEFRVRAPLKEVGLTKAEIRELSAQFGLPTAEKPQMACLSSRVPQGEQVSAAKLSIIEQAEEILRDLGFYDVRVRHHELSGREAAGGTSAIATPPPAAARCLARIEVGPGEVPRLLDPTLRERVSASLKKIGYAHVTVDLEGYRRGNLNKAKESSGSGPDA